MSTTSSALKTKTNLSTLKRQRQIQKKTLINKAQIAKLKTLYKKINDQKDLALFYKQADKLAKRNIIHKSKSNNLKSQAYSNLQKKNVAVSNNKK